VKTAVGPTPGVLELDGFAWREAGPADATTLEALASLDGHRTLFNLPGSEQEFAARVGGPGFRRAMLCYKDNGPIGAAATRSRDQRNANLQLMCFFAEPEKAVWPLALYVRHLFWSAPLHRVYLQLPIVAGAPAYIHLLESVGFQQEGLVRGHGLVGGKPCDVALLGLLRIDCEAWCQENESRLVL
jgi:hypothetical protein